MSQEIMEGIRTIEREKGIESETLVEALEDALLAAYKKTPGAARHATVEMHDDVAQMHADAYLWLAGLSQFDCRFHRSEARGELQHEAVARRVEHASAVTCGDGFDHFVQRCDFGG